MEDTPSECDEMNGIDPSLFDVPTSHLDARKSTVGENAGRGLFAAQDIPANSTLDLAGSVTAFYFWPSTWSVIEELYEASTCHIKELIGSMYTFAPGR